MIPVGVEVGTDSGQVVASDSSGVIQQLPVQPRAPQDIWRSRLYPRMLCSCVSSRSTCPTSYVGAVLSALLVLFVPV